MTLCLFVSSLPKTLDTPVSYLVRKEVSYLLVVDP